jgi:hypothetical protein
VRKYGRHWFKKDSLMSEFSDHFGIAVTRHKSSVALRAAKTEAELASKAKSEFIANMSHELRTPLNAVIGFSEMLQHKPSDDPQRVREYAGYINEAAEHLLALISSILDVSKIQAGKLQVDRSHIDPDPIVRSCLLITEIKAREKGITVEASLPQGPLSVYADPLAPQAGADQPHVERRQVHARQRQGDDLGHAGRRRNVDRDFRQRGRHDRARDRDGHAPLRSGRPGLQQEIRGHRARAADLGGPRRAAWRQADGGERQGQGHAGHGAAADVRTGPAP